MRIHSLRFTAFAFALLAIGASLSAQGRGPGFGPGRGGEPGAGRGFMGMQLTEAQQVQVKGIHDRHQASLKAKGDVAAAAHKAMREAMANAATDAATLKVLHEKVAAAQFEMMLEHRALRQEILPLLTAEQKAWFEKGPMGMGARRGPRKGPGAGPGFGPGHGMGPDCPMVKPS